jgi:hypothetical protein
VGVVEFGGVKEDDRPGMGGDVCVEVGKGEGEGLERGNAD